MGGVLVERGLFCVGLGFIGGKFRFRFFSWFTQSCFNFFGGLVWGLLKVGEVYLHCASWGLVRLEKQQSRKKQRSRTVEKQKKQRSREKKKNRKAKSREAEKQRSRETEIQKICPKRKKTKKTIAIPLSSSRRSWDINDHLVVGPHPENMKVNRT